MNYEKFESDLILNMAEGKTCFKIDKEMNYINEKIDKIVKKYNFNNEDDFAFSNLICDLRAQTSNESYKHGFKDGIRCLFRLIMD